MNHQKQNFVVGHLDPLGAVVVFRDGMSEKLIALFGSVAMKARALAHFIHRFMHGVTNGRRQRFGHIANTATNHTRGTSWVRIGEGFDPSVDFRKEIASLEFQVV